jgi:hypothetical protein
MDASNLRYFRIGTVEAVKSNSARISSELG